MEENIITELNKLQMENYSVKEILEHIRATCTDEEKEYIKHVYQQGGTEMGDYVLVAASLL